MAGLAAIVELDIKKIVALSTLRQLGVIVAALGAQLFPIGFFHLLSHAYFKALLFISVGAMIHLAGDYQDMRIISLAPSTVNMRFAFFVLANLSLCGLPFTGGFYSKDSCIELFIYDYSSLIPSTIFLMATALTRAYTARFILLVAASAD